MSHRLKYCQNPGYIHAQNTSATANIENNLVLEEVAVLVNGVAVGTRANVVFLLDTKRLSNMSHTGHCGVNIPAFLHGYLRNAKKKDDQ